MGSPVFKVVKFGFVSSLVLGVTLASAADIAGVKIHGFASGVVSKTNTTEKVQGITQTPNFNKDTRLGLNLSSQLGQDWTVAGQLLARGEFDNYQLTADWAFVTYRPVDRLAFRAGRQVLPLWMYSDQIDVGYNYTWVRPPSEVYSLNPLKSYTGVSGAYTLLLGGFDLVGEIFYGQVSVDQADRNEPNMRLVGTLNNAHGFSLTANNDFMTVRAAYGAGHLDLDAHTINNNLANATITTIAGAAKAAAAAQGASAAVQTATYNSVISQLSGKGFTNTIVRPFDGGFGKFISLGTKVELMDFVLNAEYARRLIAGTAMPSAYAYYGTLGYRLGRLMPHFTYSYLHQDAIYSVLNAASAPTLTSTQRSFIAGLNYRVVDSVILKGEYQNTKATVGPGLFYPSAEGKTAHIVNLAVDVIF